jgi:hypothetical protein
LFFVQLYRWFPSVLKAITIIRPETVVRWHRAGFRRYWRWRSRRKESPANAGLSLGRNRSVMSDRIMLKQGTFRAKAPH